MAVQFHEPCDGGADGVTVTTSNTVFTTVTGSPVFDEDWFVPGGPDTSILSTGPASLRGTVSGTSHLVRAYFRIADATPASNLTFAAARTTGAVQQAGLRLNTAGTISLLNVTTQVDVTSFSLNDNEAVGYRWKVVVGDYFCEIYREGNLYAGATPNDILTGTLTAADCIDLGFAAFQTGMTANVTHITCDDASMPALLTSPATAGTVQAAQPWPVF